MPSRILAATLAAACVSAAADAHHSFAMFDSAKTVTVAATVQSFRWAMPHVWIDVTATLPSGDTQQWGMECHSPNIVARKGWSSHVLKPGDKISIAMHPMRDGSTTGSVIYILMPDGRKLWNSEDEHQT